jgi:hypothetical protein
VPDPSRRRRPRRTAAALAGLVLVGALGACTSSTESYCSALRGDRAQLTELARKAGQKGGEGSAAFASTVRVLTELRDKAPEDVSGDWDTLVSALQGLRDAIEESGASPAELSGGRRPPGVTSGQFSAVRQAAAELSTTAVQQAGRSIEQHSLDVCKVDLGRGLGGVA